MKNDLHVSMYKSIRAYLWPKINVKFVFFLDPSPDYY